MYLYFQWHRLLGAVAMFRSRIDFQFPEHFPTERAFRQHAFYRGFDNAFRLRDQEFFKTDRLDTAWITGMSVIELVSGLLARDPDLIGVNDNDIIAAIHM